MRILSVNTGKARAFKVALGRTGIFKVPQQGRLPVHALGVGDDDICDLAVHGGTDQAVYLYGMPDYAFWEAELGRTPPPGKFGENLTVSGLESQKTLIGDRLRIGSVLLEFTSPRNPCTTFAKVMGDSGWVKRFHEAGRPGVYARVLEEGDVAAGDEAILIPFEGEKIPITELTANTRKPQPERMKWLLKAPLHKDLRERYERALKVLEEQQAQQQQ